MDISFSIEEEHINVSSQNHLIPTSDAVLQPWIVPL